MSGMGEGIVLWLATDLAAENKVLVYIIVLRYEKIWKKLQ